MHQPASQMLHELPVAHAPDQASYVSILTVSKALSDPIRVRMVRILAQGRRSLGLPPIRSLHVPGPEDIEGICVYEFQEAFQLGQSKVSYHLRILREAGLVTEESRGKWSFYSINREAVQGLINSLHDYFHL